MAKPTRGLPSPPSGSVSRSFSRSGHGHALTLDQILGLVLALGQCPPDLGHDLAPDRSLRLSLLLVASALIVAASLRKRGRDLAVILERGRGDGLFLLKSPLSLQSRNYVDCWLHMTCEGSKFLFLSNSQSVEELTDQVRLLQAQLSEVQKRLSCWCNPDKVDNIEHLR